MLLAKVVGRGVDTLVLNVYYADKHFQPIKQELAEYLQNELNLFQSASNRRNSCSYDGSEVFLTLLICQGSYKWLLPV